MTKAPTIEKAIRLREAESEILDLKEDTYITPKSEGEWLKDVTAFANAGGGRLLLGVSEDDDGRANEAVGVSTGELDTHIQTLRNLLKARTDPDVSGVVKIDIEENDAGKKFIVVDVEESLQAPHRIIVDNVKMTRQVYVRKGRDSHPVSMSEIREIVMGRHRTLDLIDEFVTERWNKRRMDESLRAAPSLLNQTEAGPPEGYLVVHVCPRRGFGSRALVDWVLALENEGIYLARDKTDWRMTQPNSLGAYSYSRGTPATLYQLFYNGAAELIYPDILFTASRGDAVIGPRIKEYLEDHVAHVMSVMKQATGCDQYQVDVAIEGVADLPLVWGSNGQLKSKVVVTESIVSLPSTVVRIGPYGAPSREDLRGVLDLVWRAWGQKTCPI